MIKKTTSQDALQSTIVRQARCFDPPKHGVKQVLRHTPSLATKMRQAGCVGVGIESGDPEILKQVGKNQTVDQIHSGVEILKSAGLSVYGQFMIGNPGDTLESISASIAFARKLHLDRVYFYPAVPFPKTKLWRYVKDHGRFLVPEDPTRFDELSPRVIFETPEFPCQDRIAAIARVRQSGFQSYREKGRGQRTRKRGKWSREPLMIRTLFRFLGGRVGVQTFLGLQRVKRTLHGLRFYNKEAAE